jgi:hypothetical protein
MNLGFDELRADLIGRWKQAFERFSEVSAPIAEHAETVYTRYPAFALESYTVKKFKAGARVARAPTGDDDYVFQLDALGRPLHVAYAHPVNRLSWQGAYRYSPEEVELLELCVQTKVPSLYNRLVLEDDRVIVEQRFVCNGGGSNPHLKELPTAAKADHILGDPYSYFIYLTRYVVTDGVTTSADEYQEVSGTIYRPSREYSYAPDGTLQRIVQHWPGGNSRTLFAAKPKPASARRSTR